jgi:hypothetical protein
MLGLLQPSLQKKDKLCMHYVGEIDAGCLALGAHASIILQAIET